MGFSQGPAFALGPSAVDGTTLKVVAGKGQVNTAHNMAWGVAQTFGAGLTSTSSMTSTGAVTLNYASYVSILANSLGDQDNFSAGGYQTYGLFAMGQGGPAWTYSFGTSNAGQTAWVERMRFGGNAAQGSSFIDIYEPVTMTKELTSTVATGTAPLSVASTTQVANLNVAGLGGEFEYTVAAVSEGLVSDPPAEAFSSGVQATLALVDHTDAAATYYFEAWLNQNTSGITIYAQLYDQTAGVAVSGSQIQNAAGSSVVRSGAITLTAGHQYGWSTWVSSKPGTNAAAMARIVGVI